MITCILFQPAAAGRNKTLPFDPAAIEPIKQVFNSFSLLSCLKSYRPIEIDKLTSKKPNACRAD
jgi:hypothetical protein